MVSVIAIINLNEMHLKSVKFNIRSFTLPRSCGRRNYEKITQIGGMAEKGEVKNLHKNFFLDRFSSWRWKGEDGKKVKTRSINVQ